MITYWPKRWLRLPEAENTIFNTWYIRLSTCFDYDLNAFFPIAKVHFLHMEKKKIADWSSSFLSNFLNPTVAAAKDEKSPFFTTLKTFFPGLRGIWWWITRDPKERIRKLQLCGGKIRKLKHKIKRRGRKKELYIFRHGVWDLFYIRYGILVSKASTAS